MDEAAKIIAQFGLQPLPAEGGWFRQTWAAPAAYPDGRPAGTAILYLITRDGFSALHRLRMDEVWHFYAGDAVRLVELDPATGQAGAVRLGADPLAGQQPQHVVRAGVWQGARLAGQNGRGWALLGCTLVPGWDQRDFAMVNRRDLLAQFPQAEADIVALTR